MEQLKKAVRDSQFVLVGIGSEFQEQFGSMESEPFYIPLLEQARNSENGELLMQYLKFHWLHRHTDARLSQAYDALADLLEGKNYFVVTLCTDDRIFSSRLDAGRIVTPCGGYRALQCGAACVTDQEPLVTDENVLTEILNSMDQCGGDWNAVDFPVCAECTKALCFNQITTPDYKEEGYLPMWQKYTKWLQGTLNRSLCVLELGVGMQYAQVIRFPFEKVVFFNQKARFFRIHSKLYQMTEELRERGVSVARDPADFLLEYAITEKD